MKRVKNLFVAFFALFIGIGMFYSAKEVKASEEEVFSPWILSFDAGLTVNVMETNNYFEVRSTCFSVTYSDPTGETTGGYFDIWLEDIGVVPYCKVVEYQYIANGETITYQIGGLIWFGYHEVGELDSNPMNACFLVDRPLEYRIDTNFVEGQYYYEYMYFNDVDYRREPDWDLVYQITNLTTGTYEESWSFHQDTEGEYEVTICNKRRWESKTYKFAIDKTEPLIYLVESDWLVETPVEDGAITSAGMKVIYGDNFMVKEMTYVYRPFNSYKVESGTVESGFIFYRKGEYTISVTDMGGKKTTASFTITDYDMVVDPEGAQTVGTEVTMNQGAYEEKTIHVGYTRCIYLGGNAPSQSRLNYTFTTSNATIATVSAYGTVEAKAAGTVIITCALKSNPSKVSKIVLTILP